jgi:BirA family transcriptional regulator, biotin operon repressor / biotin---[acetyl-CoA-carboxylase] ligase
VSDPREWHTELPSTQDRAIELARGGALEGTRVVAGRQVGGRGRSHHRWESPPGGLYLSIVLRSPDEHIGLLPFALGASLAEELGRRYRIPLRVKWPNDILVVSGLPPSRKLAGILLDRVASPNLGVAAIAGIGVNVTTPRALLPRELHGQVAVLSEHSPSPPDLGEVERIVVDTTLRTAASIRTAKGVADLRQACRDLLWGVGRRATIDGRPVGTIVSLGDEGELLVEHRGERMAIRTGDLRVDETA